MCAHTQVRACSAQAQLEADGGLPRQHLQSYRLKAAVQAIVGLWELQMANRANINSPIPNL